MNEKTQFAVDPDGKWSYRVGGITALILATGYLLTFPVYALAEVGAQPTGVEARLIYFGEHATGWWAILGLMVFTDLLYIPVWLALSQALKGIKRDAILLASAFAGLFVALDLAVTWTAYSSFLTLGGSYVTATTDAQRAVLVAAAGYPSAVLDSPLSGTYAILVPSIGVLLTGIVMLKGVFNKTTAYLALAVGISGIVAAAGPYIISALGVMRVINAILAMIWFVFVGFRLIRLAQQTN